ncbi:hypothetical protein CFC21_014447 [Triticum aestivum]|uniref:Cytochrome P450 n=2 Tax=Triticum aestivum TaxID=4565 RepID=A0A3B6APV5_WHEAT|nr:desmethyl-deoxy-podophyllotoxin synthase-like [Triticum aestivum]KAF6998323.1 hypothetical protein CFC21_014447 [Triticum aestivum]
MDHQLSYGLGLIAVGAILSYLVLSHAVGAKDTRAKLPPGPWNLPVVGSLHHLVGTLPHHALLRLSRRYGQLMLLRLGEVPTVIVSTPEAAMEVLKTKDLVFASRPSGPTRELVSCGGKGLVLTPYGEHWRQMRKVCMVEVLSTRQVRRMDSIKQDEIADLVNSIVAASPAAVINLGQGMAKLANNIIAKAVFGGKCQQQGTYLDELDKMLVLVGGFCLVDLFPSSRLVRWFSGAMRDLRRSHGRVQKLLGDIIVERKNMKENASASAGTKDNEDLLDVLLRLQNEDTLSFPLTSEIIGTVIFDIFAAATDTTAATLEWAMAELIRNPKVMARAKLEVRQSLAQGQPTVTSTDLGNLQYLRMVIKETLRLHPPVPLIRRATQDKCQVMGYHIPKGIHVMINVFAVGRDPSHWGEDAAEFRPERFERNDAIHVDYSSGTQMEFVPFGFGRRQCPGALFATTTIELVLANLLYRFDWSIPGGASSETLDMNEVFGLIVHCRSNLCVQAATCHPQLH